MCRFYKFDDETLVNLRHVRKVKSFEGGSTAVEFADGTSTIYEGNHVENIYALCGVRDVSATA
jgi:hypothetical protein